MVGVMAAALLAGQVIAAPDVEPPGAHRAEIRAVEARRARAEAASAKAAAASPAPAGSPAGAPLFGSVPLWTSFGVAEAKALFTDRGGTIERLELTDKGFVLQATVPQKTYVAMEAMDCRGQGEAKRCTMYMFEAGFRLDSDARAAQVAADLSLNYVGDHAKGPIYTIWRMGTVADGVSEAQVRGDLDRFLDVVWASADEIWPSTKPSANPGSAPSRSGTEPGRAWPSVGGARPQRPEITPVSASPVR